MSHHVLIVRRQLRWHSSPDDGGRYDLSDACTQCGTGAKRLDPLFVSPSACKAGVAATYKLQVVVSKEVFERLSEVGVRCLRRAVDKKRREPVDFWSLEPEVVLPRWSPDSSGFAVEAQCPQCRRDGFFDRAKLDLGLIYDTLPIADALATWEHFGNSRLRSPFERSLFADPRLIVSDRVREVLCLYRGVEFYEVKERQPNQALQTTPMARSEI